MLNRFRRRLTEALETGAEENQRQGELDDLAQACTEAVLRGDWRMARFNADMYRHLRDEKPATHGREKPVKRG